MPHVIRIQMLDQAFGHRPAGSITAIALSEWFDLQKGWKGRPWSAATTNRMISVASKIFRHGTRQRKSSRWRTSRRRAGKGLRSARLQPGPTWVNERLKVKRCVALDHSLIRRKDDLPYEYNGQKNTSV
jgi:hypothetical protein